MYQPFYVHSLLDLFPPPKNGASLDQELCPETWDIVGLGKVFEPLGHNIKPFTLLRSQGTLALCAIQTPPEKVKLAQGVQFLRRGEKARIRTLLSNGYILSVLCDTEGQGRRYVTATTSVTYEQSDSQWVVVEVDGKPV